MKNLFYALLLLVITSACQTPYGSEGFMGGYSDIKISDSTYRVSYAGNDYISFRIIRARAKLRAGEIAIQNGFDYLVFGGSESYRRRGVTYTVRMFRFNENIRFNSKGKTVCTIKGEGLSKVDAEKHVRNKIASCLGSNYLIATDVIKIYGYAR